MSRVFRFSFALAMLLLTPLYARADSFDFINLTGPVTGTFGGAPITQTPVPFGQFQQFSNQGFSFTAITDPSNYCFISSAGTNCNAPYTELVGTHSYFTSYGFNDPGQEYLAVLNTNDKSRQFAYSMLLQISRADGGAFSLTSFNASPLFRPGVTFPGDYLRQDENPASITWTATLAGGGTASGLCSFDPSGGGLMCLVNESGITSITLVPNDVYGSRLGNYELVSFDASLPGSTVPEPSSLILLGSGLAGLLTMVRRQRT